MENKISTGGDRVNEVLELKRELDELLSKADLGYKEVRRIDEISERLDVLEPVVVDFSKELEWKKFEDSYLANSHNKKHKTMKRRYKIKLLLIAVIVIIFANILSTAFVGANMLSAIHIFTDESLIIRSKEVNLLDEKDSGYKSFRTIKELEDEKNITLMLPTYLPDDYELDYITASEDGSPIIIAFASESQNDEIRLIVSNVEIYGFKSKLIIEKDANAVQTVVIHNIEYNIFSNNNKMIIEWINGDYAYILEGSLQEKQIKKIIKNIR